ncbi:S15/NS1 RNA-binding domain-containing protein, partial [Panus rudis PR-1116 ss-1]
MLRSRFTQCSRLVASSSAAKPTAALHTSSAVRATAFAKRQQRAAEKKNAERRAEKVRIEELNRPHVVLGNKPGDEAKWNNCDLAKVLIREEDIVNSTKPALQSDELVLPQYTNYGVTETEKELLFHTLPALGVEAEVEALGPQQSHLLNDIVSEAGQKELKKATMLASLLDLRNANARGIAYANRRRIIAAFSEPGKPNDTGRSEVQAALLTYTIRKLWEHMSRSKKDYANRRNLRRLVHQRAKILRYLKRTDRDRYEVALDRMGLEPGAVEGELVV